MSNAGFLFNFVFVILLLSAVFRKPKFMLNNNNYPSNQVPVQISEMTEWNAEGKVSKHSILINVRDFSPEKTARLLEEVRGKILHANTGVATEKTEAKESSLICSCGDLMVLRNGSRGYFFGCNSATDKRPSEPTAEEIPVIQY
jgi:hypothetical protein